MDSKAIVDRLFALLDGQKWNEMREALPANVKCHLGGMEADRDGWLAFSQAFYAGFPDGRHDHELLLAHGEYVTMQGVYRGTHKGPFQGIPATGRAIAAPYVGLARVVDGRLVELWAQFDSAGLLAQLGALPSPDAAGVVLSMFAACDRGDWDACRRYVADGVTAHIGGQTLDRDAWMGMGKMFIGAFSPAKHEFSHVLVSGDRVTTVATFHGTHTGDFMGVAPTGKTISFPVIHVDRVVDGKIVEHRGEFDPTLLMKQLQG
jgi:predicted ester cyclase